MAEKYLINHPNSQLWAVNNKIKLEMQSINRKPQILGKFIPSSPAFFKYFSKAFYNTLETSWDSKVSEKYIILETFEEKIIQSVKKL